MHRERNMTYLDEVAAIQFALRKAATSDPADVRRHTISLLADLQQQQSNEISAAISKIKIMVSIHDIEFTYIYEVKYIDTN